MKHKTYPQKEEEHHLHEEFVIESYRGCRALRNVQRAISESLGEHIHISNIALAYEGHSSPLIKFNEGRKLLIERVRKILLGNPKYISALDEARAAIYHSNFHCGLHGR